MAEQEKFLLDSGKSLSTSRLWELQYAIYDFYGPAAWTDAGVPFYMTSNPYTARQYAKMALGYVRDCISKKDSPLNTGQPLYIFDLGAGTGRFGYLFLRELCRSLSLLPFEVPPIRYVMTDMIKDNLEHLQSHPYLQEFIQNKILDFAIYHTSFTEEPLTLQLSHEVLTPATVANPITIIGNYFFDVVPQDLFKVIGHQLHEGQLSIYSKENVDVDNPDPSKLRELETSYHYSAIADSAYYSDPMAEQILREYAETYKEIPFTVPVAAFQTIQFFKRLSQGRMLLLAGDQGVCSELQLRAATEPLVSVQGGVSLSVSYHAIAKYVGMQGGTAWLTSFPDPMFVVIAAACNGTRASFPETTLAFEDSFEYFQPSDYWRLTSCTEKEWKTPSLDYLLLLLKLGRWDPLNFHAFFSVIHSQISAASESTKQRLKDTITEVWKYFYPVSDKESDFILNLGVLLFELKDFEGALLFFERALGLGGESPLLYKNLAACYSQLHRPIEARRALAKSLLMP